MCRVNPNLRNNFRSTFEHNRPKMRFVTRSIGDAGNKNIRAVAAGLLTIQHPLLLIKPDQRQIEARLRLLRG